jgi:hypothetical protein
MKYAAAWRGEVTRSFIIGAYEVPLPYVGQLLRHLKSWVLALSQR